MRAAWLAALIALAGCGERVVELSSRVPDASVPIDGAICVPGETQCSNCIDDDDDGDVDGFDVECTGRADDDEATFATGIGGDNSGVAKIDCFYDGNGGSGDDDCDLHVCCLLDDCPSDLPGPPYDPSMCGISQECTDNCEPLTPPGCDCFGCCTVCEDGVGCVDIYVSPALAPDCDASTIGDPDLCPRCTPSVACGQPCGGSTCVLCPGQDDGDLPASCAGATCPDAGDACTTTADCGDQRFCAAGCCISAIP